MFDRRSLHSHDQSNTVAEDLIDFGAQTVQRREKPQLVRDLFTGVAGKYDLMNDFMSIGVHRLWKRELIRRIAPKPLMRLLDVAGGTGDVTRLFLKAGGGMVTLSDLTPDMLAVGRQRLTDAGFAEIDYVCAAAETLPFRNCQFDVYTISFGLRNVSDRMASLAQAHRVLKPGGRFFCLEFSPRVLPALQRAYDRYCDVLLPRLGEWVASDEAAYRYLVESIRRFRHPQALCDDLQHVGFRCISVTPLSAGIVNIHQALRT